MIIRLVAVAVIAVSLFVLPHVWGWSGLPLAVIAFFVVLTFFLVRWHARHTAYECPSCDYTFVVSAVTDFLSPHLGGEKLLRCPRCGLSSWCRELDRARVLHAISPAKNLPAVSFRGATLLRAHIIVVTLIYLGLWIYTFYTWPSLPAATSAWWVLKIPLITLILPILHIIFCTFAIRQGYQSRIYLFVSLFVIVFLLLAVWMQHAILSNPA